MRVKYLLNGNPCNPVKRDNIYLEVNHDLGAIINQDLPSVSIKNLRFAREDVRAVIAEISNTGGPGITEGVPFDIVIDENGQTNTINMFLDLMEELKSSKNVIEAVVKMMHSLDWLDAPTQGFTFESLYNETGVAPFQIDGINYTSYQDFLDKRCIYIPYVLSSIPNRQDAFQAIFSITYIIIELTKGIKFITQWTIPIPDGAGGAFAIGQLIAEIAFMVLLIAALVALIIHLFNCLIQPVKYHGAMLVVDMIKIVAQKTGLVLNSSIWDQPPYNQWAYLPEKYNPVTEQNPAKNHFFGIQFDGFAKTGFTSPGYATSTGHDSSDTTIQKGYYNGMGGDLLRLAKRICNGKIIIPDQTSDLVLERRDYYPANPQFNLPDIRQDWNGWNTDELFANIILKFSNDLNDKNSMDKYLGTIFQATHQQVAVNNKKLIGLKGLREINFGVARGVRKDNLNFIETVHLVLEIEFNSILNAGIATINLAIDVFNNAIKIVNLIIAVWNLLMDIIDAIITVINNIISAISSLFGGNGLGTFNGLHLQIQPITLVAHMVYLPLIPSGYSQRIGALLLENDMVSEPKLIMVDTARPDFTAAGGYSGQQRIAYVHVNNSALVNAKNIWDKFYFIDAFVGAINNRFTKIAPATNGPSDTNPITLRLADFKNLVSNAKFNDNFGEEVIAETIQWYIEKNGRADIHFRKKGWLKDPQNVNGLKRAEEININLALKTSIPNGQ